MKNIVKLFSDEISRIFRIDAHYFISGGFWLSLTQATVTLFGLIATILMAHYLSEVEYGIYKYILGLALLFSSFSLTGIGQSIFQASAKNYTGFYRETLKINVIYNLGTVLAAMTASLYYLLNDNLTLSVSCALIAVIQPIVNSFQNLPAHLQGQQLYKNATKIIAIRSFFVTLVTVSVLLLTTEVTVLIFSYFISNAAVNLLTHLFHRDNPAPTPPDEFKKHLNYAKHTSARNFLSNVAQRADTVIIFTQLGAVELAIYSISMIVPEQIKAFLKNIAALLLPKYTRMEKKFLVKSLPKRSFQLFVAIVFIAGAYILIAPILYKIIFPKYPDAVFLTQLLALSFPAMIAMLPMNVLQSKLEEKNLYRVSLISSLAQLISTLFFTLIFGLIGAIVAKVFHRYFVLITAFYYVDGAK